MPSTIQAHAFHSAALKRDWTYIIYLPDGYRAAGPRYPVVYLLHGNSGDANDWLTQGQLQRTVDGLIERREIAPVVIVMPQGGTDWYVDRKEPMETAFFNDLLPEIESRYAVSARREQRVIGGVSMGGFGALRYALIAPERFCAALLLSPAIYADVPPATSAARHVGVFGAPQFDASVWHALNYPALWNAYMSRPWRVPIFIGAGDAEPIIRGEANALYARLAQRGNPATLRIVSGGHTWDVWRALLGPALAYALSCLKSSSAR
ncbi:MAG TPA: alpha/beta hydrolase-fold protein [Trinickia sp.]|nr:alpha/beta hydrolase-fold protein [Trinickia sp.]